MPPMAPRRQPAQDPRVRAAVAPIPFTAAAHRHVEPITVDTPAVLGAAQQQRGPFDVPAYGFMRHIILEVTLAGGTLGAGVLSADFPWNIIQNIQISDVNGYGSLANQNAAASYKLSYTLNTAAAVFSTAPTTAPTPTVRAHLEAWSQPNEVDLAGRPQLREPPGHGTTQFWSAFTKATVAGQNNVQFPRVGNLIRNLVVIARNAAGARADNVMPDPIQVFWDARSLTLETQALRNKLAYEAIQAPAIRDVGVFAFPFDDLVLGHAGDEEPNFWLPTMQSSRLELNGVAAVAGTLQVCTNDVAPVEVNPAERYVETSTTGFHPAAGPVPAGV
jgi:hypothetical protein